MLKGKIHRATVTQAELDYVGSITVDIQLLEDAGIFEYEKVQIVDVNNGARFETYTIAGERGSGVISFKWCGSPHGTDQRQSDHHGICRCDAGGSKTAETGCCVCG